MKRSLARKFAVLSKKRSAGMLSRKMQTIKWLPFNLDIIVPCAVLLMASIIVVILTISKTADIMGSRFLNKDHAAHAIKVQRIYLDRGEYLEYSPTLARLNPGIAFTLEKTGGILVLAINNEELFPDLMMALHTLQSFKPGVAWEMDEFCVRTCPDKAVARVTVKGFKQELR
ncbi:MAG: hypothetical protein V4724_24030 [Pseudomonadota bacterium]